ncbi:uncharacterized protein HaLaN_14541 [Haematococcus lacustris]|uniref:PSI domain-containing protein n=1 Tax=Haematococcus lacustris TaxID=44745 RepID=A0A699ZPL3_HAELA|nr:uncharacterized protein HaLaN_14541 [Haematococcus lacustris]
MQRILFLCSALCTIALSASQNAPGPWDLYIKGPLECVKTANATSCDILENCAWCASSGIGTGCYPLGAAKILPRTYFTCDKLPEHPAEEQDPGLLHKAFNSAKMLPSAIFKCKSQA